jgi:hypothetical protein
MLFDLRGRGRRRTVRVVYTGLAVLIGIGLVGFGIGGGFGGGGILSAANNNEGSGSASFADQIKKYEKLTRTEPRNLAAWEGLVKARLQESSNFTSNGVTPKGKELFQQASEAWQSYIALNPPKPNTTLAAQMAPIYSEEGLNQPTKAVAVLQLVIAARPNSAALYAQLAQYAYKAKDFHTGDLAAAKAVSLAPAAQRVRVHNELVAIRQNPTGEKVFTTTTNGKTYAVKKAAGGTFTGTEIQKTPQPAGTGTTTTKK